MEPSVSALRSFIVLAEELHFGRAADRLYTSAPALSRQIGRLEKQLHLELFTRTSRTVRLTPKGAELLVMARQAITVHNRISAWAKTSARNVLRIGFVNIAPPEVMGPILTEVARRIKDSDVEFHHIDRDSVNSSLTDGEVDIAFVWGPFAETGIDTETLWQDERELLVHSANPLSVAAGSAEQSISIRQCADQTFLQPMTRDREFARWAIVDPRPDDVVPKVGQKVRDIDEALAAVANSRGVYLIPATVAHSITHTGVATIVVHDIPTCPFIMCWSADRGATTLISEFVDTAGTIAKRLRITGTGGEAD
ncbi:LysR family transcriptional regulator [Rhodococcoides fascians]|uniref:LysR family transcriptional regulator n=1 Tax=Rhodococcoides fascians TaxID=1828 RepID=UPI00056207DE|nr:MULTISPECIES: LysR family transcriptional regulator [Rhodococcus]OZF00765.1 LysR family transcriptional regulator [Rhodococcus sp. 15-1189-1-1a]OZF21180.1 LysR family transcriptional regulator [Rhodococcus sp. 14-2686-1-2]